MGILDRLSLVFGLAPESQPPRESIIPLETPIDEAARAAFRERREEFYGGRPVFVHSESHRSPIESVSVYAHLQDPHWHYVSCGLDQFGFELTFRLAADSLADLADPSHAPMWPVLMLHVLARRTFRIRKPFEHGSTWEGVPGILHPHSSIYRLAFSVDPELGIVEQEHRRLSFIQAFAVDDDEFDEVLEEELDEMGRPPIERIREHNPLLITRNPE